jgi:hypothetical protein
MISRRALGLYGLHIIGCVLISKDAIYPDSLHACFKLSYYFKVNNKSQV